MSISCLLLRSKTSAPVCTPNKLACHCLTHLRPSPKDDLIVVSKPGVHRDGRRRCEDRILDVCLLVATGTQRPPWPNRKSRACRVLYSKLRPNRTTAIWSVHSLPRSERPTRLLQAGARVPYINTRRFTQDGRLDLNSSGHVCLLIALGKFLAD